MSRINREKTRHRTDYNRAEFIANFLIYRPRIIREAIKTTEHTHNFTHEDGYRLSKTSSFRTPHCTAFIQPPQNPSPIDIGKGRETFFHKLFF
jgi:hypothetical protein